MRAGVEARGDVAAPRTPPPVCTGTSTAAQIARSAVWFSPVPNAPSRSTTCSARAPAATNARARATGIGVVARLARRIAALEPHGASAAQIDRGIEGQRAHGYAAAIRTKLSSSVAPVERLFSGWNCVAITLSRATIAAKRSPNSHDATVASLSATR